MAAENETPRQKMISIMYLVLTALLALNVSKEVINAFLVVNESVVINNENFAKKIRQTYDTFEKDYNYNPTEVGPFWEKAKEARMMSSDLMEYIETLKYEVISYTEKISLDSAKAIQLTDIQAKDNYTEPTNYFIGNSNDGSAGKAGELRIKLEQFRTQMTELVDERYRHKIRLGLETNGVYYDADKQLQNWEMHQFYYTILVADIAILNNLIAQVYNAEYDIVKNLYEAISAEDYNYDNVNVKVLARSNYVFVGDSYEAEIVIAAYDTSQNPEAYYLPGIDSLAVEEIPNAINLSSSNGKINVNIPATRAGVQKFAGIVRVANNLGDLEEYHFSDEFIVAKPSLTVSATKMNVLYVGVDNNISISAPGVPEEKLMPTISIGSLERIPNSEEWNANVPVGYRQATIKVSALVNGTMKEMGIQKFRVKKLPDPVATIANKSQGFINRDLIVAAGSIVPKMPNDFEYDLSFKVQSFMMTVQRGFTVLHYKAKDGDLTEEMVNQIRIMNRGQNILFEDIVAVGPDGDERSLSPIVFSIN